MNIKPIVTAVILILLLAPFAFAQDTVIVDTTPDVVHVETLPDLPDLADINGRSVAGIMAGVVALVYATRRLISGTKAASIPVAVFGVSYAVLGVVICHQVGWLEGTLGELVWTSAKSALMAFGAWDVLSGKALKASGGVA